MSLYYASLNKFMVPASISFPRYHAPIAAVAVASLASTFFQSGDLSECGQPKSPACKRVKFDFAALVFHVRLKFMVGSSLKESLRRFDDGEDCGLEWSRKFFPSGDYLGQIRA